MSSLAAQFEELVQSVEGYFSRNDPPKIARANFLRYRDDVLASISGMDEEFITQNPELVAGGFIDQFQFKPCAELKNFTQSPTALSFAALKAAKAIQITEEAKVAWTHLFKYPEAAIVVVALCAMSEKNPVFLKVLKN